MRQQSRVEVRIAGVWCPGEVWDWEKDTDGWFAIVSALLEAGKPYIGKVPVCDVRVTGWASD